MAIFLKYYKLNLSAYHTQKFINAAELSENVGLMDKTAKLLFKHKHNYFITDKYTDVIFPYVCKYPTYISFVDKISVFRTNKHKTYINDKHIDIILADMHSKATKCFNEDFYNRYGKDKI